MSETKIRPSVTNNLLCAPHEQPIPASVHLAARPSDTRNLLAKKAKATS